MGWWGSMVRAGVFMAVLTAWLAPSAAAAKGAKKPKKGGASVAAVVLPQPPPVVSPLDGTLRTVPLIGPDDALDIETMVRSRVSFDIRLDNSWLADIDEHIAAAVLATLSADPRWRVTEETGVVLAQRRDEDVGVWSVPRLGFHATSQDAWRIAVRFSPWTDASAWATSPSVVRMDATDVTVSAKAFGVEKPPWYGRRAVALSADGPHLGYDIYELGSGRDLRRTVASIEEINDVVWHVIATADGILSLGPSMMPLPTGEPGAGRSLTLDSPGPSELRVRARVNPGVPGWTWVRLVTAGAAWSEAEVGAGTRERVGWSTDAGQGFYLQGTFAVPRGPAFPATAEVWVQPDDGGAVRQVASFEVVVPER